MSKGATTVASWVYILECSDGSYYVGCTTNIDRRIGQHRAGTHEGYTSTRLPVEVVYVAEFQVIHDAIDWERKLKRWTRAKKTAVIEGRWGDLPSLSLSRWRRGGASFDTPALRATQDDEGSGLLVAGRAEQESPDLA